MRLIIHTGTAIEPSGETAVEVLSTDGHNVTEDILWFESAELARNYCLAQANVCGTAWTEVTHD